MRIDAYNQVRQIYQTQKTAKAKAAYQKTGSYGSADQLQISQTGKDYHVAKQAVGGVADVREDLVAQMKERVANGTYQVDVDDFATKLLEKYNAII